MGGTSSKACSANLETLSFHQSVKFEAPLLRKSPQDPALLQNLTELALVENHEKTYNSLTIASLRNILQAIGPHLAKVSIQEVSWDDDDESGNSRSHDDDESSNPPHISITELLRELLPWKKTMRELSLSYREWDDFTLEQDTRVDTDLLAAFQKLEKVFFGVGVIDVTAFVAALSPRLRHIKLGSLYNPEMLPDTGLLAHVIQCLLDATRAGRFPHLKTVWFVDNGYGMSMGLGPIETTTFGQLFQEDCGVQYTATVHRGERDNDGIRDQFDYKIGGRAIPINTADNDTIPDEWYRRMVRARLRYKESPMIG